MISTASACLITTSAVYPATRPSVVSYVMYYMYTGVEMIGCPRRDYNTHCSAHPFCVCSQGSMLGASSGRYTTSDPRTNRSAWVNVRTGTESMQQLFRPTDGARTSTIAPPQRTSRTQALHFIIFYSTFRIYLPARDDITHKQRVNLNVILLWCLSQLHKSDHKKTAEGDSLTRKKRKSWKVGSHPAVRVDATALKKRDVEGVFQSEPHAAAEN